MLLVRDSISDEDFEKNWKDWSGTNFLVEKGKEHGMEFVDSLLYRVKRYACLEIKTGNS